MWQWQNASILGCIGGNGYIDGKRCRSGERDIGINNVLGAGSAHIKIQMQSEGNTRYP